MKQSNSRRYRLGIDSQGSKNDGGLPSKTQASMLTILQGNGQRCARMFSKSFKEFEIIPKGFKDFPKNLKGIQMMSKNFERIQKQLKEFKHDFRDFK